MEIYRSASGRQVIQDWCTHELERVLPTADLRTVATPLGPTHLTTVGVGPNVVLLPGTNFGAATSTPLIAALAGAFRVTTVDLPGQPGLSCGTRLQDNLVAQHRRWLAHVLGEISGSGQPPLVIGESLGAAVALCAEPGPHIGGLILVVPAGLVGARVDVRTLAATLPWLLRPTRPRAGRLLATMASGAAILDANQLTEWMTLVPEHVRSSLAPAPLPNPVLSAWRNTPCQVVVGARDRIYGPHRLADPAQKLLHCSTTVVPYAGHLLTHTAPYAVAQVASKLSRLVGGAT